MPTSRVQPSPAHEFSDTSGAAATRYVQALRGLSGAERLRRALELTVLAREMAWQGALHHAGDGGRRAAVQRFLRQLHGDEVARRFEAALGLTAE